MESGAFEQCLQEVEEVLSVRAGQEGGWSDQTVHRILQALVLECGRKYDLALTDKELLLRQLFNRFRRLDRLQPLMEDDEVTDILINGRQNVYVERLGELVATGIAFESDGQVTELAQRICDQVHRQVNQANPMVDARLPDGSRLGVVLPPVALDGPVLAIRKFAARSFTLAELTARGTLTEAAASFLAAAVAERRAIFISGGTGSGKTTLLNTLANLVPAGERIVTVEDAAELRITGQANLVRLEARPPNTEGKGEITMRQLVRMALRLRPDRIIVGEVRGEEALDMLQAMNTGHKGAMSSGHANSAGDMLERLETMAMMAGLGLPAQAIRRQIGAALDLVVHMERREDGRRQAAEILVILDWRGTEAATRQVYKREAGV
ncbi:MAG: CpaF family protein [Peptococcaceae bacterium]|jgi:pilus assembly protein CpaF|nr:CpaF family protein [Peptococcaceae bacterium]